MRAAAVSTIVCSLSCLVADGKPSKSNPKNVIQTNCQERNSGPFITADYLFWHAYEDGLEYAREVTILNANPGPFVPSSSSRSETFSASGKWSSGARAGIGYLFGDMDRWDLYLNWTYFFSKSQNSKGRFTAAFDPNHYYAPIWHPFLGTRTSAASEHWTLHYNTLDLELGRHFYPTNKFSIRPHAGLRGVWIDQDIAARYMGAWSITTGFAEAPTSFRADNDFKGIGLRAGGDLRWHFAREWSVLGQFSAALLYGKFDVLQKIRGFQQTAPDATPSSYSNVKENDIKRIRTNLQIFLGFDWKHFFNKDKYAFSLSAGYEFLEWFQQNETSQTLVSIIGDGSGSTFISEVREGGNLGLQGLTIKGRFDF